MAFRRLAALVEVVLVIVLGRVEGHRRAYLRDGAVTHLHQFAEHTDGGVTLFGIVEPNGGEVLCADVDALTVDLLEVVDLKEIAHQGFVGNKCRVIIHFDGLQMPRGACLDLFVARIFEFASHEADGGLLHAFEALEVILHTPEAAC